MAVLTELNYEHVGVILVEPTGLRLNAAGFVENSALNFGAQILLQ